MLPIYICEDDRWQLERYKKLITEILESEKLKEYFEIVCVTNDPDVVLEQVQKNSTPGLYFLDVKLEPGMIDGIELGVRIRKLEPKAYIVMVTVHADAAPMVFKMKVEAKDYILKDRDDVLQRTRECVLDAYNVLKPKAIEIHDFIIMIDEIYYMQVITERNMMLRIHGKHKCIETHGTIANVESKLGNQFYKCLRSYIVNLKYVVGVDKKRRFAVMENGDHIPISRNNLSDFIGELEEIDNLNIIL